jgi:hypothetical protein
MDAVSCVTVEFIVFKLEKVGNIIAYWGMIA